MDRFFDKVDKTDTDGCWQWTGAVGDDLGYGRFWYENKLQLAHRVSYKITVGEIPKGMQVNHACDNPRCVNPAHLKLGSHEDNMRDREERGRTAKGEDAGPAKLTEEQVRLIHDDDRSQRVIAKEYGVAQMTVNFIKREVNWRHLWT